ncbi:D-3-phosphoglycerate dehydrogenase [Anaerovirgula multivorans]|uniref:D-3-phosphoglycerate dehydrogenase n=1 Tax=Anaerovirgula multivorans TaxID=312168 RepID=A0A239GRR7_9FIRM|nr:2-hydroxyacid dehydrogenase [Anaerovirgula multivorans]SNS70774.1 D-3-phosphoglycerate dehydrogenase [Anaerovirgula multivorans]
MKVALVGIFPSGAKELFTELLPAEKFQIEIVDTQEKYDNLTDAEIIILRIFKINREVIERNKNLRFIQKWGAGFDTIDIEAAGERNIYVANAPGANAYAVSELAVMHILAVYRNLIVQHDAMKKGEWTKNTYTDRSYGILGKTVGLIGCGSIGKGVAKKVQAFGATVQYYDAFRMSELEEKSLDMKYVELEELLKTSDIISVHVPLIESTRNLINKEKIELMKPTAIIINTARGGIINEGDLIEALKNNRILGAGLDCIANEPVQLGDPILEAPNVTLTPHIGGTSADLLIHMVPLMAENIINFEKQQDIKYVVNKEYFIANIGG